MRRGFSLIEVLVALLVFEVGMLATSALALQALRTQRDAVDLERARWAALMVLDSLASEEAPGSGAVEAGGLLVLWSPLEEGALALRVLSPGADPSLELRVPTGLGPR